MASHEGMTDEQKLEELFEMTNHTGWKLLITDLEDRVDSLKEGLTSNRADEYQLGLAQGHIKVYRELINLRNWTEMVLKEQQEADLGV